MNQIPIGLAMAFAFPHLFFFLVFVLPFSAVAQTNGNVTVGTSLSATANTSSSWLSPSGDFAFGFRSLNNEDLFLLSIWYDKIPEKTTVWYANGDRLAPSGSTVQLTADRGLVLNDPQGEEIWRSDPIIGSVAYGVMNDTGNFALKSSTNSDSVWESFKNPTDTMLPTQTMERGGTLSSRQTETNFSLGRFQLRFQTDGNLVLRTINLPTTFANAPYYASGTNNESDSLYSGMQVVFNESGFLYILRENDRIFGLTQGELVSARDFYHRATLNFDGVLTQYYHPKTSSGNGNWSVLWSEPEHICLDSLISAGSGTCGYNSVCRLNTDRRPICECPRGYSLVDPTDVYGSCKPNFIQSCEEDGPGSAEDLYKFEEMTNTDWPLSDYLQLKPYSEERCKESCLQDCLCSVAIFREGNSCWKKKIPLSNGRVDRKINGKAFLKIRKDNSTPRNPIFPIPDIKKKKQDKLIVSGSVLLGSSVFINFILAIAICVGFSFIYKKLKRTPQGGSVMETNLRCFNYEELVEATDGFKEELGRGAFGVVYKGAIPMSSSNLVAVKKLDRVIRDGEKEFKTEVAVIGQTHHKNLVRLLGFCNEGPHRLLVYEFLRNGTLASFLFGDLRASWKQRTQIAIGIARGLLYLHEECSTQIIHCDIKPQNILLDDYYNARISDFGLAKLLMIDQSQTYTGIRGTKGYVAPDWFRNMPITVKVDVYSFGVLLLEVVSCRRCVNMEDSWGEETILTDWAYNCYREGTIDALVSNDMEALNDIEKLKRFVMVAIWCIQEDPSLRPTMRKITQMKGLLKLMCPHVHLHLILFVETKLSALVSACFQSSLS